MKKRILGINDHYKWIVLFSVMTLLVFSGGCALFNRGNKGGEKDRAVMESAFDSQQEDQNRMSDYVASAGRQNPNEKKKVSGGETFLLSDKAREIYANTER